MEVLTILVLVLLFPWIKWCCHRIDTMCGLHYLDRRKLLLYLWLSWALSRVKVLVRVVNTWFLRGWRLFDFKVAIRTSSKLIVDCERLRNLLDRLWLFIFDTRLAVMVMMIFWCARFVMLFRRSILFALWLHALGYKQQFCNHIKFFAFLLMFFIFLALRWFLRIKQSQ